MLSALGWILVMVTGTAVIVWGAELFAEHLAAEHNFQAEVTHLPISGLWGNCH